MTEETAITSTELGESTPDVEVCNQVGTDFGRLSDTFDAWSKDHEAKGETNQATRFAKQALGFATTQEAFGLLAKELKSGTLPPDQNEALVDNADLAQRIAYDTMLGFRTLATLASKPDLMLNDIKMADRYERAADLMGKVVERESNLGPIILKFARVKSQIKNFQLFSFEGPKKT